MTVYLCFNDVGWRERGEDDPHPDTIALYGGPIPRAGEAVHSDGRWWRVLHVAYSSMKGESILTRVTAWVDVTVRIIPDGEDPREAPP